MGQRFTVATLTPLLCTDVYVHAPPSKQSPRPTPLRHPLQLSLATKILSHSRGLQLRPECLPTGWRTCCRLRVKALGDTVAERSQVLMACLPKLGPTGERQTLPRRELTRLLQELGVGVRYDMRVLPLGERWAEPHVLENYHAKADRLRNLSCHVQRSFLLAHGVLFPVVEPMIGLPMSAFFATIESILYQS